MSEVTESNLTLNIIDQRSLLKNVGYLTRDKLPRVRILLAVIHKIYEMMMSIIHDKWPDLVNL